VIEAHPPIRLVSFDLFVVSAIGRVFAQAHCQPERDADANTGAEIVHHEANCNPDGNADTQPKSDGLVVHHVILSI
jgi:hypothetical protein